MEYLSREEGCRVFIPYNVPSSKNSKIATRSGVFHSKTVGRYLRALGIKGYSVTRRRVELYKTIKCLYPKGELSKLLSPFRDRQIVLGVHFVRGTKMKFDFHNACQIVMDMLVAFDLIEDDNMDCMIPVPMVIGGKYFSYNKENPGVYLSVLKTHEKDKE